MPLQLLKTLKSYFHKFDHFLDHHKFGLLLLACTLLLRVPSFAEPYWYGDEAIYLTVGNSLRAGERMYVDIMDHKTPLIYYFAAASQNQLGFRLLTLAFVLTSVAAFFILTKDFFKKTWIRVVTSLLFVAAINLPAYEGNIPNGELFMMSFVLLGLLIFRKTPIYYSFFSKIHSSDPLEKLLSIPYKKYLLTGVMLGVATLIKVPAVLEMGIFFVMGWIVMTNLFFDQDLSQKRKVQIISAVIKSCLVLALGWLLTIIASVIYFWLRGSLTAYINFGLLYNFRYAGSWTPTLAWPFFTFLLDLKVKLLLLVGLVLGFTAGRKYLSPQLIIAGTWLGLTLVAATLSNRPYPHYFLQIFPGVVLLCGLIIALVYQIISRLTQQNKKITLLLIQLFVSLGLLFCVRSTFKLLQLERYETVNYYKSFFKAVTGKITWTEYGNKFNWYIKDNALATSVLKESDELEIFIWGNNPLLYALSGKNPVGRFIVSFHIDDFQAHQETLDAVIQKHPTFIVVMNDQAELPGLNTYLQENYRVHRLYSGFKLWKKREN